jgi:predicted ribosome quality control (RQC) complex YloA/Tae2 family protein
MTNKTEFIDGKEDKLQPEQSPEKEIQVKTQASTQNVEKKSDDDLVEAAYGELKKIFVKNYEAARSAAMLEAGKYIVETFYGDNYALAKVKKQAVKKKSLNQLIKKLQDKSNGGPTKTWVYDAVGLAVDEHELKTFRTYGNISVSHKLKLLPVKDIETKKQLATETIDKNLSVRDLSARIKEMNGSNPELKALIRQPTKLFSDEYEKYYSKESLSALAPEDRSAIKDRIARETKKLQEFLNRYEALLEQLAEITSLDEAGDQALLKN